MAPQPRRNAAALLASQGTQQFSPWNPEAGQLDMSLYEYALRHPDIKNLGVLKDQWIGSRTPEAAAQYEMPENPQMLEMTPGKPVGLGPKPVITPKPTAATPNPGFAQGANYKDFVKMHGGKSTANLAGLFKQGRGEETTTAMRAGMLNAANKRKAKVSNKPIPVPKAKPKVKKKKAGGAAGGAVETVDMY